ncbi:hypothetical protein FGB62_84g012 [Gracilaria domingensis]|nr:hypothetical protein FGB62_84g012 [Gracilaria domingensis]
MDTKPLSGTSLYHATYHESTQRYVVSHRAVVTRNEVSGVPAAVEFEELADGVEAGCALVFMDGGLPSDHTVRATSGSVAAGGSGVRMSGEGEGDGSGKGRRGGGPLKAIGDPFGCCFLFRAQDVCVDVPSRNRGKGSAWYSLQFCDRVLCMCMVKLI